MKVGAPLILALLAFLIAPVAADAQSSDIPRIGVIALGSPTHAPDAGPRLVPAGTP